MTTAKAAYASKGLTLQIEPRLREINLGEWEDLTWSEAGRRDGEMLARFGNTDPSFRAPGGESFQEVQQRRCSSG